MFAGPRPCKICCFALIHFAWITWPKCFYWDRVQRSFVWINKLLNWSLTLKNVYTCRLARLISPMGSLWIYCKRFLRFLSDPDRLCCSPFWKSITASHSLAGARHVARRVTVARSAVFYTVSRSCEPSVSWFVVYRMCNETVTRSSTRSK